jgi:hypothetical protein
MTVQMLYGQSFPLFTTWSCTNALISTPTTTLVRISVRPSCQIPTIIQPFNGFSCNLTLWRFTEIPLTFSNFSFNTTTIRDTTCKHTWVCLVISGVGRGGVGALNTHVTLHTVYVKHLSKTWHKLKKGSLALAEICSTQVNNSRTPEAYGTS